MRTFKQLKASDGRVANEHLRKLGTIYPTGTFEQFYKDNARRDLLESTIIETQAGAKTALYAAIKGKKFGI